MAKTSADPTIIKKYANRRLYNTGTSTYVTLEDLAAMVKENEDFIVKDAKTSEDITHSVLTQIIFEQEAKTGQTMLPVSVLRQLISFYGDQMQMVVPSYLEHSMAAFAQEQNHLKEQMAKMVGKSPIDAMATSNEMLQEQTRRNMEMFQNAMRVFNPFLPQADSGASAEPSPEPAKAENDDISTMRDQIAEMQRKLDTLDR
ncbi:MAG: polyhydroxyalkanoate synthesis repressor PhaR [Pseudomonadota bacterium]